MMRPDVSFCDVIIVRVIVIGQINVDRNVE